MNFSSPHIWTRIKNVVSLRYITDENMKRREFLKSSAIIAVGSGMTSYAQAKESSLPNNIQSVESDTEKPLIDSAPMLQNYAETSMGIAFSVTDMANGYVIYGEKPDLSDGKKVKCGGFRVTDMNNEVMQIRLTGLKPATKYYYKIGADRINYQGGYSMHITGTEEDPRIYSFTTAGKDAVPHFCVINDTHVQWAAITPAWDKIAELNPSCVIWNGDASNVEETITAQKRIFLKPEIARKDYAAEIPYLFGCGNHDSRGMANRHMERVWMYRQPEERSSRDWDLGRNFAVRMGDIAMIGLDTAEDKQDTNPLFAGLFNSTAYREAQVDWLRDALQQPEIASAPYLVAFCHIPLFDPDPKENPGDLMPADKSPEYKSDFASWQRTCAKLWTPLLQEAGCQLIITAHQHRYRFDEPTAERTWAQIVGGGPNMDPKSETSFPTVIEGAIENKQLKITIHNVRDHKVQAEHTFAPRKVKKQKSKK